MTAHVALFGLAGLLGCGIAVQAVFAPLSIRESERSLALLAIPLGPFALWVAYGQWEGRPWAWTLTVGWYGLQILLGVASLVVRFGTVAEDFTWFGSAAVWLAYFQRTSVRAWFGRGPLRSNVQTLA